MEIFSSVNFWSLYIFLLHLDWQSTWNLFSVKWSSSKVSFFLCGTQIDPLPLSEKAALSPTFSILPLWLQLKRAWIWVCFWMLFSVLFIRFYPCLYCSLNHCSFVVNFYVWDCKSLNLVLIQRVFFLCSALYFYMNFRIRLSISIHLYTYKYAYEYC